MNDLQQKIINKILEEGIYQNFEYSENPGKVVKMKIEGFEYFLMEDGMVHQPPMIICDLCKHSFELK